MIQPYWTARSLRKLLWGLCFAVAGLLIVYTLLCLPSLPEPRVFSPWELLLVPAALLLLCLLFYGTARPDRLRKDPHGWLSDQAALREAQIAFYADFSAVACLFVTAAGMVYQTSRLELAKGRAGLPIGVTWGLLGLGLCISLYSEIKVRRMRSADPDHTKES